MKKIFYTIAAFIISSTGLAQKKPATPKLPSIPDVNTLMKMSPSELEAYKHQMLKQTSSQMKQTAAQGNIKIDEMLLPDFKVQLPPKDLLRLSLIPKQPPTLIQLANGLRQSKKNLEGIATANVLEEVKAIVATQTPEQQHTSAIAEFYADKPVQSLLVSINSVLQNPSDVMGWNNLAAIMNMTGLEHKAIPILMNQLLSNPNSSLLLNNMGQAYLGLGDIGMAEMFLKKCLAEDPMNPEANRSMGMIRFANRQYEEGMQYFEKELAVAYRKSSMALMRSKNPAFNLLQLRKQHKKIPQKNFIADLQLGRFKLPSLPATTDQTRIAKAQGDVFYQSVGNESIFWSNKSLLSDEELAADGNKEPELYAYLVDALLQDLQKIYQDDELALITDLDVNHLQSIMDEYQNKMANAKCPEIPANATLAETKAI
jgi:tetratricopeptide (TPR) repeat protein